jgi:ABC-type nitrate/sulfonate/bicarbonate transport system ATPase subunit
MILVTRDIDEAIYMSDRMLIMTPRPGRIDRTISVEINRPGHRSRTEFLRLRSEILQLLHLARKAVEGDQSS